MKNQPVALETATISCPGYTRITSVPNRAARRLCRKHAGAHLTCPVEMVPGRLAPRVVGESYYHTTPSGKTRVYHPNAYKWRTVYHCSTLCVEVGRDWLLRRCAH